MTALALLGWYGGIVAAICVNVFRFDLVQPVRVVVNLSGRFRLVFSNGVRLRVVIKKISEAVDQFTIGLRRGIGDSPRGEVVISHLG